MFLVGVSGVARSGKNLFCDMVIEELNNRGYSGKQFALANALKRDCEEFLKSHCHQMFILTIHTKKHYFVSSLYGMVICVENKQMDVIGLKQ